MNEKELFLKQFEMLESRIDGIEKTKFSHNFIDYVNLSQFIQWETQVDTLLKQIYPPKLFPKALDDITSKTPNTMDAFYAVVGLFRAAHEDFKNGLLDDLQMRIESGVVVDYLQQAEALLEDEGDVNYSYIPAAVLTGATLEKSLRTLCGKQKPPIDTNNENGKPKKARRLFDDLKKTDIFTPVEEKQVETWLETRNSAAHGRDKEFTRDDVASMIRGVTAFLAKHMG